MKNIHTQYGKVTVYSETDNLWYDKPPMLSQVVLGYILMVLITIAVGLSITAVLYVILSSLGAL